MKVGSIKDHTGLGKIAIVACLFNQYFLKVAERFLFLSSSDSDNVLIQSITDVIL